MQFSRSVCSFSTIDQPSQMKREMRDLPSSLAKAETTQRRAANESSSDGMLERVSAETRCSFRVSLSLVKQYIKAVQPEILSEDAMGASNLVRPSDEKYSLTMNTIDASEYFRCSKLFILLRRTANSPTQSSLMRTERMELTTRSRVVSGAPSEFWNVITCVA
jgi:hypothetical protein